MNVTEIVERLRPFSWAYIDTGFRQGREAVLAQFRRQLNQEDQYNIDQSATVDQFLSALQSDITDLRMRAAPYDLPEDYIFFLEYYGGLAIEASNYSFTIYGTGTMVETWYGFVNSGDHVLLDSGQLGWQSLGYLVFRGDHKYKYQRVQCYVDLAASVQRHAVIGVGPWDGVHPQEIDVLGNIHKYPEIWKKLASSFTEFLERAAETRGAFVYT